MEPVAEVFSVLVVGVLFKFLYFSYFSLKFEIVIIIFTGTTVCMEGIQKLSLIDLWTTQIVLNVK